MGVILHCNVGLKQRWLHGDWTTSIAMLARTAVTIETTRLIHDPYSPHLCVGFLFLLADSRLLLFLLRLLRRSSSSNFTSQLISHNSSHTTSLTQLISHNSSHTTHLTQLISHNFTYTTSLTQLISHNSPPTTHLQQLM